MHGPTAAAIRSRRAPERSIAAIVASVTPASAPRQPACAAPTTPASAIGEQHRRAIGGEDAEQEVGPVGDHRVGMRPLVLRPGSLDLTDVGEWTWWTVASSAPGSTAAIARRRFSAIASRSSPLP